VVVHVPQGKKSLLDKPHYPGNVCQQENVGIGKKQKGATKSAKLR
jgi:hypothetical protein